MRFQVRLLEHLRAAGYPAVETEPGRPERGGGDVYDAANPAHLEEAGRALARYHQAVRGFRPRFRAAGRPALPALERSGPHALSRFTDVAGPFLGSPERARLTRASSILWSQFIWVPEALAGVVSPLPQLVVHGSYDPTALIFQGDRVAGVTGYDRAAYDLRALDLVHALGAFSPDEAGSAAVGLDFGRSAALMAAYREIEPLPAPELAALPLVFRAQSLSRVLIGTAGFLRRSGAVSRLDQEARRLVDMVEREADRVRGLEAREPELRSALAGSLVA